ncbi:MAG TPA: hypothetical protein VGH44_03320 [Candidatus Saccharimonadia bacterium]|jgi:uncharacterized membrane protein YobD (UPF0266 family)
MKHNSRPPRLHKPDNIEIVVVAVVLLVILYGSTVNKGLVFITVALLVALAVVCIWAWVHRRAKNPKNN